MNNSNSTGTASENTPNSPESTGKEGNWQENYEEAICATEIPQPSRYQIQIKGHCYSLTRGECIKLHHALLKVLPNHKQSALETIKLAVSRYLGVPLREMNSHARPDHIFVARAAAMYLANRLNVRRTELVESFDRHYTAISYALRSFEKRLSWDNKLKAKIDKLEAELRELLE